MDTGLTPMSHPKGVGGGGRLGNVGKISDTQQSLQNQNRNVVIFGLGGEFDDWFLVLCVRENEFY